LTVKIKHAVASWAVTILWNKAWAVLFTILSIYNIQLSLVLIYPKATTLKTSGIWEACWRMSEWTNIFTALLQTTVMRHPGGILPQGLRLFAAFFWQSWSWQEESSSFLLEAAVERRRCIFSLQRTFAPTKEITQIQWPCPLHSSIGDISTMSDVSIFMRCTYKLKLTMNANIMTFKC
jgi:hypothetical protein